MYSIELEIKDTTDTALSDSYLDLYFEINSEGRWSTKHYHKWDDFNFPFWNVHFYVATPAYGVYISQLIRYSRYCGPYQDFLDRMQLLTRKLWNQGYLPSFEVNTMTWEVLWSPSWLVYRYLISASQMTMDYAVCRSHNPVQLTSFMTLHRILKRLTWR